MHRKTRACGRSISMTKATRTGGNSFLSIRATRKFVIVVVSSILPSFCYALMNCGGITLNCSRIIKDGFNICWSTSFRTRTLFSTPGSGCSPAKMEFLLLSVMMTNLSIAGAAPVWSTFTNFRRTSRGRRSSSSNRITGRQRRY